MKRVSVSENTPQPGVLARLRKYQHGAGPAERSVIQYILDHPASVIYMPITELSEETHSSDATIIRVCRQAGFRGYQDLKISLARDTVLPIKNINERIDPGDDFETAMTKVFTSNVQAVTDTGHTVSFNQLSNAADLVLAAEDILIFGVVMSGLASMELSYKLLRIGVKSTAVIEPQLQAISTAMLTPRDVVIGISHSGSSKEIVNAVARAKKKGAKTIAITNFPRSPLAELADVLLLTAANETPLGSGSIPSMVAQLSVIDALFVAVALKSYDKAVSFLEETAETVKTAKY